MPIKIGDMELYDVEELSKLLGIQDSTIRKLLKDGTLKGRKLARRWFVTDQSIKDYFNEAETVSTKSKMDEIKPIVDSPGLKGRAKKSGKGSKKARTKRVIRPKK